MIGYILIVVVLIDLFEKWRFSRKKEKLIGKRISMNYIEYYEYYISKGIFVEKEDPDAKNKPKGLLDRILDKFYAKSAAFHNYV